MEASTQELWAQQDQHQGDRWRLFSAVAEVASAGRVLYAGSYVDIAPSFVYPSVTYVDVDRRAKRFFDDSAGVQEIIASHQARTEANEVTFIGADYSADLGLNDGSFDLLISLYAGFVSEHCTRYLRVGGTLLVNASHGDAAMASIDDRYKLVGVVKSRDGDYRVRKDDLDSYLVPKRPTNITVDYLHDVGKAVAYTKTPFAYLFQRIA